MSWEITLVHGNEDVRESTAKDYPEALKWVEDIESEIHGPGWANPLESMKKDFTGGDPEAGHVQFGTNYHYVVIEKRADL